MTPVELKQLKQILIESASKGYAADAPKKREADGSDTVEYRDGAWRFHDNYFTSADGSRFYGREVVFKNDQPVWFMGYAGFVTPDAKPADVYTFLKQAMLRPNTDLPIRGPLEFSDGDWDYQLDCDADLEVFAGAEIIRYRGEEVYFAYLHGGIIC